MIRIEDDWTRPTGNLMLGVSRTLQGDSVTDIELRTLSDSGGRLVLTTISSAGRRNLGGDSPAPNVLQFVDSTSSYPHVVSYRDETPNQLVIRREGTRGGKHREIDALFDRAMCAANLERPSR